MDDLATCKYAAEIFYYQWHGAQDEAGWPKGCYAEYNGVRFNQHTDGSKNNRARQICKPTGKELRCFLTSMYLLS